MPPAQAKKTPAWRQRDGFDSAFDVDTSLLEDTMWFEEELMGNNATDFFHSRPVEYSKNSQTFDADDLGWQHPR